MHVLVTSDAVGGVWTYTRELVSGLVRRGHRVSLVSFGQLPKEHQLLWMRGLPRLEYYATDFPLEWMQDSEQGISASIDYLLRLIHSIKPDVLHSNQYCYGALQCSIPKIVVAHSDVLSWWSEVHGDAPPQTPSLLWYRDLVSTGLARADVVVAPSHWMLDALTPHYSIPAGAVVVYNGRDAALFQPSLAKSPRVLSVGRVWDEGKQITLLLKRPQALPVCIAGPNQHPERRQGANAEAGSADQTVELMGIRSEEELCSLYAKSAIYAMTSRYEPFGLAPVEAALSGCALIANDIPTFRELWGDAAIYFHRNDPDALADAIRTLGDDRELCEDFANRACRHARERFDSQRMVSEYETLYHQVACQRVAA